MDNMQDAQASGVDAPSSASPLRQKPSTLASIAIQSFAAFRSQTSSQPVPIAVQSPVRRKPLPADSPVAARFSQASLRSNSIANKDKPPSSVLSPPLTDEGLFVPRNLDRSVSCMLCAFHLLTNIAATRMALLL